MASDPLQRYYSDPAIIPALIWGMERYGMRLEGLIGEVSCGTGNLVRPLEALGFDVMASDIDEEVCAHYGWRRADFLEEVRLGLAPEVDWHVANPPFTLPDGRGAADFVMGALETCRIGVAMFVRDSFTEPCEVRRPLFDVLSHPKTAHRPVLELKLPRIRFHGGGNDQMSAGWLIWLKHVKPTRAWPVEPIFSNQLEAFSRSLPPEARAHHPRLTIKKGGLAPLLTWNAG